jgi:hypothetical protein
LHKLYVSRGAKVMVDRQVENVLLCASDSNKENKSIQ